MNTDLFPVSEKNYGKEYKQHLLEQYKLYVESVEKISDRRQNANNHFLTINAALVTLIGLTIQLKVADNSPWIIPFVAFIGIIFSSIFWYLIKSYKQLNTAKFIVIHEIEAVLPIALYRYEWHGPLKAGKDQTIYYPFSHIEMIIPLFFAILYLLLFVLLLIPCFSK